MYIQLDEKDNNQWKFYFTRTSFRLQNQYYKDTFARYFPKNELPVKVQKEAMDERIKTYLQDIVLDHFFSSLSASIQQRLINVLILFLFSHRHNKGDDLVENTLQQITAENNYANFDLIRNVCYKYSKGNLRSFFRNPYTAFLFHQFASSEEANSDFIKTRMDDKETKQFNEIRYNKVREELHVLKNEAIAGLKESSEDMSKAHFQDAARVFY